MPFFAFSNGCPIMGNLHLYTSAVSLFRVFQRLSLYSLTGFFTKEQIRFGIEKFGKLDIKTLDGKKRLIDGFVNSIYLFDDKFTITFNFKDGTKTIFFSEIEAAKNSDIKSLGAPKKRVALS